MPRAPPELIGIHTNMPATVPDDVAKALQAGGQPLAGLSPPATPRASPETTSSTT
jgi:hypothetical protein